MNLLNKKKYNLYSTILTFLVFKFPTSIHFLSLITLISYIILLRPQTHIFNQSHNCENAEYDIYYVK